MANPELKNIKDDTHQIAFLVTAAAVLQILESLFPNPFPGIRLGLANIVTLVTLVNFGFKATIEVAILRTIISSFIIGTFLSPSFLLSFVAALLSSIVMAITYHFSKLHKKIYLSLVGISITGAITHNMVQILLVYIILIRHTAIFMISPWLLISSIVMGWINGLITIQVCKMLDKGKNKNHQRRSTKFHLDLQSKLKTESGKQSHELTIIHKTPSIIKIILVLTCAIILIMTGNAFVYGGIFLLLGISSLLAKIKPLILVSKIRRLSSFLLISFFIPVLFTAEGVIVFNFGFLKITQTGVTLGSIFVIRLILLMISTTILIHTSTTEELIEGLSKLMKPLEYLKIDTARIAKIITLSWTLVPIFTEQVFAYVKKHKVKRKTLKKLSFVLYGIITMSLKPEDTNPTIPIEKELT